MVQYICRTECERISGVEVLTYRIRLPKWENLDRISAFYAEIEERTRSFCEMVLKKMAREIFEASEDPKKYFCFPTFRYTLEGQVVYENTETDIVSVRLLAELKRRGSVDCLERQVQAHTWSLSEEVFLPVEQIAERLGKTELIPRKNRKMREILVDHGEMFFCQNGGLEKLESALLSKKSKI